MANTNPTRASRALAVLAEHPEGMLTPEIAQALGEYPWALVPLARALRKEEAKGVVTGTAPCRGATVLWELTEAASPVRVPCGLGWPTGLRD